MGNAYFVGQLGGRELRDLGLFSVGQRLTPS